MFKNLVFSLLILAIFFLHQDFWNWKKIEPLIFGVLPVGLAYHAFYAIVAAAMMAMLVKFVWPAELDRFESSLDDNDKTPKP